MGLFSKIFGGGTKSPNTTRQEQEAQRQAAAELERYRALLEQQTKLAEQQRADEERRYQEQVAAQQAEAERQRAFQTEQQNRLIQAQRDEATRQETLQRELEATRQGERNATMAQQQARADAARQYVEGRMALMDKGRKDVEQAFSGFDDAYFDAFAKSFVGQFKPQLERAYDKSRKDTTFGFSDTGNLRSSAAGRAFGDLRLDLVKKEGELAGAASDASTSFRNDIENQKSDALSLINSAGGVGADNLPDGVTDIGGMLEGLGAQIGSISQSAQRRAQTIRAPSFASQGANVNLNFTTRKPGAVA